MAATPDDDDPMPSGSRGRRWSLFRRRMPVIERESALAGEAVVDHAMVRAVASVGDSVCNRPCFGVIDFPDVKGAAHLVHDELERAVQLGLAQYVTVDTSVGASELLSCFEDGWQMHPPGAVFSIAGGVSNLRMQTKLAQVITRGIANAVRITQGWVVTGGMDAGVARLVASGLRRAGVFAPCVGIARWEGLEEGMRESLVGSGRMQGDRVLALKPSDGVSRANSLEPHHSHFIFVAEPEPGEGASEEAESEEEEEARPREDASRRRPESSVSHRAAANISSADEPGPEEKVRRQLEERLQTVCRVPRLMLAVQGEGGTFESIVHALKAKCGVIVVRESGGAALTIAQFMDTLRPPHRKALTRQNPQYIGRVDVPHRFVPWAVQHPAYKPAYYVSQSVIDADSSGFAGGRLGRLGRPRGLAQPSTADGRRITYSPGASGRVLWADPEDLQKVPESDALAHRISYEGKITFDSDGYPRNPRGRTGLRGRGVLGKWGPNHAADPIITRRDPEDHSRLQVLVTWRPQDQCYAIPGQLVRPGSKVGSKVRGCFERVIERMEGKEGKAADDGSFTDDGKDDGLYRREVKRLFEDIEQMGATQGEESLLLEDRLVYRGYVDDPRNTDQAWMETTAMSFHVESEALGRAMSVVDLAQDGVRWVDVDDGNPEYSSLFASHKEWIDRVAVHLMSEVVEEDGADGDEPRRGRHTMHTTTPAPSSGEQQRRTRRKRKVSLVSPEAARFGEHELAALRPHLPSEEQTHRPAEQGTSRLTQQLHTIGTYRSLITVYPSASDQSAATVDELASAFADDLLDAILHSYHTAKASALRKRALSPPTRRPAPRRPAPPLAAAKATKSMGGGVVAKPAVSSGSSQDDSVTRTKSAPVASGWQAASGSAAYEASLLQLLVRWGRPKMVHQVLMEPELGVERTDPKLRKSLQESLLAGTHDITEMLLNHADERTHVSDAAALSTQALVAGLDISELYGVSSGMHQRRNVDVNKTGDVFGLLQQIKDRHDEKIARLQFRSSGWEFGLHLGRSSADPTARSSTRTSSSNHRSTESRATAHAGRTGPIGTTWRNLNDAFLHRSHRSSNSSSAAEASAKHEWVGFMRELIDGYNPQPTNVQMEDLFLWSVVAGKPETMLTLWRHVETPCLSLLVAKEMCVRIRERKPPRLAVAAVGEVLDQLEAQCQEALLGLLDQVRHSQAARAIIVEARSSFSVSRSHSTQEANLLELGIHLRNRAFVGHAWCQTILDEQWCGRDSRCGRVMLSRDPGFFSLVLLALVGWLGIDILELEPNPDFVEPEPKQRRGKKEAPPRAPPPSEGGGKGVDGGVAGMWGDSFHYATAAGLPGLPARRQVQTPPGMLPVPSSLPAPSLPQPGEEEADEEPPPRRKLRSISVCDQALDLYHTPCVKHKVAFFSAIIRLSLFAWLATSDPRRPTLEPAEVVYFGTVASELLAQLRGLLLKGHASWWRQSRNRVNLIFLLLTLAGCGMRVGLRVAGARPRDATVGDWSSDGPPVDWSHEGYKVVMAFTAVAHSVVLLQLAYVYNRVGVLVMSLRSVMATVGQVMIIFFLILFGASLAFEVLLRPEDTESFAWQAVTEDGLMTGWRIPWFAVYGAVDLKSLLTAELGKSVAPVLLWLYLLAVQIAVLNLLIAIMTDTYFNVARSGAAETRWRMSRVNTNNDFLALPPLPTPLDLPWLVREVCIAYRSGKARKERPMRRSTLLRTSSSGRNSGRNLGSSKEEDAQVPWEAKAREVYLRKLEEARRTATDEKAMSSRMSALQDSVTELHASRRDERQLLLELRNNVLGDHASALEADASAALEASYLPGGSSSQRGETSSREAAAKKPRSKLVWWDAEK